MSKTKADTLFKLWCAIDKAEDSSDSHKQVLGYLKELIDLSVDAFYTFLREVREETDTADFKERMFTDIPALIEKIKLAWESGCARR